MKKIFLTVVLVLALVLSMVGCGESSSSSVKTSDKDLLTTSSATIGMLLNGVDFGTTTQNGLSVKSNSVGQRSIDQSIIEEKINPYITMIEGFIGSNPVASVEKESDKEGFEKLLEITINDITGETSTYKLYYNQILVEEEVEEDEVEQEYAVNGILIVGETEYAVEGKREVEDGEYEFSFKASIDSANYIMFEQEIENDEQEFNYSIFKNGICISAFSLEIENQDGEQSIELKTELLNVETSIKFEKEVKNGKSYIKAELKTGEEVLKFKVEIEVNEETGEKNYIYEIETN